MRALAFVTTVALVIVMLSISRIAASDRMATALASKLPIRVTGR